MTTTNNTIAKFAAVVAMLGLVASSAFAFAPAARAADSSTDLQAQINALLAQIAALQGNTGTTAAVSFTQDLTLGASGAQVTALQNWLISKGFTITAGATGYFGAQTAAALAKYQASAGITPASGYFGPITRAKVNAAGGSTTGTGTGTGTGTSTGGLSGDEANLTDYDLKREESSGAEGEEEVQVATAEFDVEDGDVRVERLEVEFQAASTATGVSTKPWDFIDNVSIWADGKMIDDMDVDGRADWDENDDDSDHSGSTADYYSLSFTGLDYVVEEGNTAEITIAVNVSDNIDTTDLAQSFVVTIPTDGIRAVDAEGIQQYTGKVSDAITFSFDSEENGDLSIRENSDNPDAANLKVEDDQTSEEYSVFKFDIRNTDDADSLLTELKVGTTISGSTTTDRFIRKATLVVDGDEYDGDIATVDNGDITFDDLDVELAGDSTTEFELLVEFNRQVGNYASGNTVVFDVAAVDVDAEGAESGDDVSEITGAASSETHTLSLTGFGVEPTSTAQSVTTTDPIGSSVGTYTIKFDVTADEDDAIFVAPTAAVSASTTAGAVFNILGDSYTGTTSASLTSTADMQSGVYRVDAGETETFTLVVTLNPTTAGQYRVELDQVHYGTSVGAAAYASTFDVDNNNADFESDNAYIPS